MSARLAVLLGVLVATTAHGAGPARAPAQVAAFTGLLGRLGAHDASTRAHARRVGDGARAIARELGLAPKEQMMIRLAGAAHDVGKSKTPRRVLTKAGKLGRIERAIMSRHATQGARLLRRAGDGRLLRYAAEVAGAHHERWDGGGYPRGLAGEAIPLAARVVAVADAYDALTTQRSYNTRRGPAEALRRIQADAGTHFDPAVVDAFARVLARQGVRVDHPAP